MKDNEVRTPPTYNIQSKLVPNGKLDGDGNVIAKKTVTAIHKAKIRRGPFAQNVEHSTAAQYRFEVPNIGEPETPVLVRAKRKLKTDPGSMQNPTFNLGINIANAALTIFEDLTGLDGEASVSLPPGTYFLSLAEESFYEAIGPQDASGKQPKFYRAVKISVLVPKI